MVAPADGVDPLYKPTWMVIIQYSRWERSVEALCPYADTYVPALRGYSKPQCRSRYPVGVRRTIERPLPPFSKILSFNPPARLYVLRGRWRQIGSTKRFLSLPTAAFPLDVRFPHALNRKSSLVSPFN